MPKIVGQMNNSDGTFESANRVYDRKDIAPSVITFTGGNLQTKVIRKIKRKRKLVMILAERGRENGQEYEPRFDRIFNTITTVSKDNYYIGKL